MSDQSQTTANAPSDPVLCKMGCGFFGNEASEGCCSKCYREIMKKEEAKSVEKVAKAPVPPAAPMEDDAVPMEVEESSPAPVAAAAAAVPVEPAKPPAAAVEAAPSETPTKKKKKKANYKSMMQGMMKSSPERDIEKEKEQLRKVTGGGAFSKIDKI